MRLRHGRVELALEVRRGGEGPALLLLHELRGSAADWGAEADVWPGPVYALDFSGHGRSEPVRGDAYYPELLAADADAALAHVGAAALCGRGIGAYAALLLAAARPESVPAALLLPGAGLDGGGAGPHLTGERTQVAARSERGLRVAALALCETDVRPVDYAEQMAARARCLLLLEDGGPRPPWWQAIRLGPRARVLGDATRAVAQLAEAAQL